MTLNEIFSDGGKFMEWLANNCYSCAKLPEGNAKDNCECELEPVINSADLDAELGETFSRMITENGKSCKCKNFSRVAFFGQERHRAWHARLQTDDCQKLF